MNIPCLEEDGIELIVNESAFTLKDIFKMMFEGKKVDIEQQTLQKILNSELEAGMYYLQKPRMKLILSCMLVLYINNWYGWKIVGKKRKSIPMMYQKFLQYLKFKVYYFIKNDYNSAYRLYSSPNNKLEFSTQKTMVMFTRETQTDKKDLLAPFRIVVFAGPKILDSICVSEEKEHVRIWQSPVKIPWCALTFKQLIHWPFVKIEFSTKYIHIIRTNENDYTRCIVPANCNVPTTKNREFITNVEIVDKEQSRKVYGINVLKEYFKLLKSGLEMDGTNREVISNIDMFFETVFQDIVDIGFDRTIATNTLVEFNIGRSMFYRCKQYPGEKGVSYMETITPNVSLLLKSFTGVEESSDEPWKGVHKYSEDNKFQIKYSCTFCNCDFARKERLLLHFINLHSMEQPVACVTCNRSVNVRDLIDKRWRHICYTMRLLS